MLADLDEMVYSCRDQQAKISIKEAILCYKAGAYKGAITLTWIAFVYDFVNKIKILAEHQQGKAILDRKIYTDIQESLQRNDPDSINQSLKFERSVIDKSNNYGFLNIHEKEWAQSLYKDRCKCAHPSMNDKDSVFEPSAESARLHIAHCIKMSLSKNPVHGREALDVIIKQIDSDSFPKEKFSAITVLTSTPLNFGKDSLFKETISRILDLIFDSDNDFKKIKSHISAISALIHMRPDICTSEFTKYLNINLNFFDKRKLKVFCQIFKISPEFFEIIRDENILKIKEIIDSTSLREVPGILILKDIRVFSEIINLKIKNLDDFMIYRAIEDDSFQPILNEIINFLIGISNIEKDFYINQQNINEWDDIFIKIYPFLNENQAKLVFEYFSNSEDYYILRRLESFIERNSGDETIRTMDKTNLLEDLRKKLKSFHNRRWASEEVPF